MKSQSVIVVCITALAILFIVGCGDESSNGPATNEVYGTDLTLRGIPGGIATTVVFALEGSKVQPPTSTTASGTATLRVNKSSLDYRIDLIDAQGVARAELFLGMPGENGTRVAVLRSGTPIPLLNGTLVDSALGAADIMNASLDHVLDAISDGAAYVQVLTTSQPLLRGQTAPSGTVELILGGGAVAYDVSVYELDGITSVTLNHGAAGRHGDPKVILFENTDGEDDVSGRLVSDVFRGSDILDSTTFSELAELIRDGDTYVNVSTLSSTLGAIRGQVDRVN